MTTQVIRGGQVNAVIGTQGEGLGKVGGTIRQGSRQLDTHELRPVFAELTPYPGMD